MYRTGKPRFFAGVLAGFTVALLAASCRPNTPEPAARTSATLAEREFVGNEACRECHEKEFRDHQGTYHDLTLRPANRERLGVVAPPTGTVPLAGYSLEERNGQFVIERQFPQKETLPLDFVIGSGKLGMTFVAMLDENRLMETRMSYFPPLGMWEVTPGQEARREGDQAFGRVHNEALSRNCLRCHSVTMASDRLAVEPKFFGVGCEACHGPGREHIALARAGEKVNHKMEDLGNLRSKDLLNLCGKCHRTAEELAMEVRDAEETQRFQTFGLLRSKCRLGNGQMLSCLSCHDPHKNAATDRKSYEAVCLSCHAKDAGKLASAHSNVGNGRPCPVNSKEKCITCHMPARKAFPRSNVPAKMVDHRIAVPPQNGQK